DGSRPYECERRADPARPWRAAAFRKADPDKSRLARPGCRAAAASRLATGIHAMTMQTYKRFTGTASCGAHRDYIISERDALLVDLAIRLGRPLLIEGEAGCGKTTLASAVARELGLDDPIIVPIRS